MRWKVILPLMMLLILSVMPGISQATSTNAGDSTSQIISLSVWPEVPLPNESVKFNIITKNITHLMIQICINDLCFIPQNMNITGNSSFEFTFTPGKAPYPYTKNGDIIYYHFLTNNGALLNGKMNVTTNNPPSIGAIKVTPKNYHVGSNITIESNITDDFGVHNATCYITTPGGIIKENMSKINETHTYFTHVHLSTSGSYFIKVVAFDDSNQSNFTTTTLFVHPSKPKDHTPPQVIDIYGVENGTKMVLNVYLQDSSGVKYAKVEINGTWYPLKQINSGLFEAKVNVSKTVKIFAVDPYNNTLDKTFKVKIYQTKIIEKEKSAQSNTSPLAFILLGVLIALLIFLPIKGRLLTVFIIIISLAAVSFAMMNSMYLEAVNAGGNIFNGNTCWSCLGLQPAAHSKHWMINYPNGKTVQHPQWVLSLLNKKPVFIFIHQVPCTGCEIQWKEMIKNGIITKNGTLTPKYSGKITFIVLDITYNSPTRDKGMQALNTYSLGEKGTPTTVILTKKAGKIYWFSKSGIVEPQELEKLLNEAISMYGE